MRVIRCACGRAAVVVVAATAAVMVCAPPSAHAFTTVFPTALPPSAIAQYRSSRIVRSRSSVNAPCMAVTEDSGPSSSSSFSTDGPSAAGGPACCVKHSSSGSAPSDSNNSGGEELTLQQRIALQMGKTVDSAEDIARRAAEAVVEAQSARRRSIGVALGSFLSTAVLFFFTHSALSPANANPLGLLRAMESSSTPLMTALTNGKPTVVDFYASWCENCKAMAPVMKSIEAKYDGKVNFVVVDGDSAANADLVGAFRVDGIPHLAMITPKGDVQTAIIGQVPRKVIEDDINALLRGEKELPFLGYDAFDGEDHNVLHGMGFTDAL